MIILAAAWILQDLLQVFGAGLFSVPDLVLFLYLYRLSGDSLPLVPVIWSSVLAGFFWDLRWASFAGPSSILYVIALVAFYLAWTNIPVSGRNTFLGLVLMMAAQCLVSLGRMLIGAGHGGTVVLFGVVQMCLALPVAVLTAWAAGRNLRDHE